jgi:alpha-L-rhamnosidase
MKIIIRIFILLLLSAGCTESLKVNVTGLKCEYKVNPNGVDLEIPRLSWISESDHRGVVQTAYQILVSSSLQKLDENVPDVWDSQKITSDKSNQISYRGKPLESNGKYFWKVKIWDQNGETYSSTPAFWTTGLLQESDWKAKWIGLDRAVGDDAPEAAHKSLSARMLRHEFQLGEKIKSATAFISGLSLFEFYLNGEKIGNQVLAPGLTEYNKRAFYMTFDVTRNLLAGKNAIGLILGNGRFFAPRAGGTENTKTYGFPKAICQLNIEF